MSGATPKGRQPGLGFPTIGGARWLLVSGFLVAAILILVLKPWPRELVPAEQVSRKQLVLQQGRLMKTSQTNAFMGLMVELYPDGTLQSRSAVSNGLLHGVSEGWHTNGVLAVRETFREGRSHGLRTKWNIESRRVSEVDIREGRIDGFHREWHTNGQLAVEVAMASGLPSGQSRRWSPDGGLVGQWSLSNGVVVTSVTNAVELQALDQKGGTP